ncbi:MAG TPA: hypothetical protein VNM90_04030 [Haliangium sp.]|nr:hypothetical protein [Haliangium sp.]
MHGCARTAQRIWLAAAGILQGIALVVVSGIALGIVSLGALPAARADEDEQRRMAAQLYAEAQSAVMGGDYARASALFDQANAILPSPQALRATIQVYLAADQPLVALARAEELLRRYPYDLTARSLALETIDQHSSRFVRVLVTCDAECVVQTDETRDSGEPGRSHIVYLTEGRHEITARFDDGSMVAKRIRRKPGQAVSLGFERGVSPAPDPDAAGAEGVALPGPERDTDAGNGDERDARMPSIVIRRRAPAAAVDRFGPPPRLPLLAGGVLTAGLGVAAVLSHRDALALEQSAADPTAAQQRTQILVGATALSAVTTLAVSIIWARSAGDAGARSRRDRSLAVSLDAQGAWVGMRGSF